MNEDGPRIADFLFLICASLSEQQCIFLSFALISLRCLWMTLSHDTLGY